MDQVIEFNARGYRDAPSTASTASWPAYPSALFVAFVLPSLVLWRYYIVESAHCWLAPLGLAVGAAEAGGAPEERRAPRADPPR
jgi:hypothetical protein